MIARSKGQLYMEKLQESVYTHLGRNLSQNEISTPAIIEKVKQDFLNQQALFVTPEKLAELEKVLIAEIEKNSATEVPTRFQEPQLYRLMLEWVDEIEEAAKDLSIPIPLRPVLGTLPTGRVNAMTVAVPSSEEYLLLFEDGLFTFALLMSKVVARAMPFKGNAKGMMEFSTDDTEVIKNIYENPEIVQRFSEVVLAYLLRGMPGAAPQYIPPEPYGSMANILRTSMELFVFGHEYGHILSGHLSSKRTSSPLFGEKVDEVTYNWQQELEADVWGLQLMLPAMQKRGYDLSLSFWGSDFFFCCMDIVERGVALLRTGTENTASISETHPPAQVRRAYLEAVLRKSISAEDVKGPIQLAAIIQQILELLWQSILPQLRILYEKKVQLAPVWLQNTM